MSKLVEELKADVRACRIAGESAMSLATDHAAELLAHIDRLNRIISECAAAAGAMVSPESSAEFKERLPNEIRMKIERLEKESERLTRYTNNLAENMKRFIDAWWSETTAQAAKGEA